MVQFIYLFFFLVLLSPTALVPFLISHLLVLFLKSDISDNNLESDIILKNEKQKYRKFNIRYKNGKLTYFPIKLFLHGL